MSNDDPMVIVSIHTDESGSTHPVGSSIFDSELDYKYR